MAIGKLVTNSIDNNVKLRIRENNNLLLLYQVDSTHTRLSIPKEDRNIGMFITYLNDREQLINEQYVNKDVDDESFVKDSNWLTKILSIDEDTPVSDDDKESIALLVKTVNKIKETQITQKDLDTVENNVISTIIGDAPKEVNTLGKLNNYVKANAKSLNSVYVKIDNLQTSIDEFTQIVKTVNTTIADEFNKWYGKIPTKVSQLENDAQYLKTHQSLTHLATKKELADKANVTDIDALETKLTEQYEQGITNIVEPINENINNIKKELNTVKNTIDDINYTEPYSKEEIEEKLNEKANLNIVYTKRNIDAMFKDNNDAINKKIEAIIDTAPENLDTLHELAEALNNDDNFASNVLTELANKADKSYVDYHVEQINNELDNKINTSDVESVKTILETQLNSKANKTDVYTKSESDSKYIKNISYQYVNLDKNYISIASSTIKSGVNYYVDSNILFIYVPRYTNITKIILNNQSYNFDFLSASETAFKLTKGEDIDSVSNGINICYNIILDDKLNELLQNHADDIDVTTFCNNLLPILFIEGDFYIQKNGGGLWNGSSGNRFIAIRTVDISTISIYYKSDSELTLSYDLGALQTVITREIPNANNTYGFRQISPDFSKAYVYALRTITFGNNSINTELFLLNNSTDIRNKIDTLSTSINNINNKLPLKQDTLTAGDNITINNNVISGPTKTSALQNDSGYISSWNMSDIQTSHSITLGTHNDNDSDNSYTNPISFIVDDGTNVKLTQSTNVNTENFNILCDNVYIGRGAPLTGKDANKLIVQDKFIADDTIYDTDLYLSKPTSALILGLSSSMLMANGKVTVYGYSGVNIRTNTTNILSNDDELDIYGFRRIDMVASEETTINTKSFKLPTSHIYNNTIYSANIVSVKSLQNDADCPAEIKLRSGASTNITTKPQQIKLASPEIIVKDTSDDTEYNLIDKLKNVDDLNANIDSVKTKVFNISYNSASISSITYKDTTNTNNVNTNDIHIHLFSSSSGYDTLKSAKIGDIIIINDNPDRNLINSSYMVCLIFINTFNTINDGDAYYIHATILNKTKSDTFYDNKYASKSSYDILVTSYKKLLEWAKNNGFEE